MKKAFSCQLVMLELHRPHNSVFAKLLLELSRSTQDSGVLTCCSVLLLIFATVNSVSDLKLSETAYTAAISFCLIQYSFSRGAGIQTP